MEPIRVYQGSAKNVLVGEEPTEEKTGRAVFEFLDYFSVFDWGRFLADPIEKKGLAQAQVSKKHFELLTAAGIKTHYQGIVNSQTMSVSLFKVPEAYKEVKPGTANYLLPIEIIFRIYTHPESSDLKKIKEGKRTWQELGYDEMPEPNKKLPRTKISYSTKLEEADRVLTKEEARVLAGLAPEEMERLEKLALEVEEIVTNNAAKVGLLHYDGKIEVAKDAEGNFVVVDVVGTLDEDRFMMEAEPGKFVDVSKQAIRNWFVREGAWKKQVDQAKKKAEEQGIKDWKSFCPQPPLLPEDFRKLISEMYLADAEARTGLPAEALAQAGEKLGASLSLKEVAQKLYAASH